MKRGLLTVALAMLFVNFAAAQVIFEPFDGVLDTTGTDYIVNFLSVDDTSRIEISDEFSEFTQGTGAMRFDWRVERDQSWGGFAKMEVFHPDSNGVYDLSAYENLSLWYYNDVPSTDPGQVEFRFQLFDVSDVDNNTYDGGQTELWYSFHFILDDPQGWNEIVLPLEDIGPDAQQGGGGFWRTGWSGVTGNNTLDLDQIKGFGFEISITGPDLQDVHTGQIIFDAWGWSGAREKPLVLFNGRAMGYPDSLFTWNSGAGIVEGGGEDPATNAIQFTPNPGWAGFGWNLPPQDLSFRWMLDTLKFKVKAPNGAGTLRAQFEDAPNPNGSAVFATIAEPSGGWNDTWTTFEIPLREIVDFDRGSAFDTSYVKIFQIYAAGDASGAPFLFDFIWTGNPEIDVIAPPAPSSVLIVPDNQFNLITWVDVPNETGETYNVYYSPNPITHVKANGVEVVDYNGSGVPENTGSSTHLLFTPNGQMAPPFYYAVTAVDAAGNESEPFVTSSAVSNTARQIATIGDGAPAGFTADGDFSEWSGIAPFRLFPSENANIVTNTTIDNDDDLSLLVYLAVDSDYLYVGMDITDDVLDTASTTTYLKDSQDLFIGLYDWHGAPHNAYGRGAEPDHQLRFLPGKIIAANQGDATLLTATTGDYFWAESFPVGYRLETRIPLADLAALGGDDPFVPTSGMRIPFDMSINDADGSEREGILTWSPYNEDQSWSTPARWLYTWVGPQAVYVGIEDDLENGNLVKAFTLEQNYPNPFNPTTTIKYSLANASDVSLVVYNAIGQQVATLVNQSQTAGAYRVTFDARSLASGIYFYRLQAGDFVKSHKMILMK